MIINIFLILSVYRIPQYKMQLQIIHHAKQIYYIIYDALNDNLNNIYITSSVNSLKIRFLFSSL